MELRVAAYIMHNEQRRSKCGCQPTHSRHLFLAVFQSRGAAL